MGGLASALALAKKGFKNIEVFEMASDLGFVGAGIQMAPNLVRVLSRLGCWESIEAEATEVLEASIRSKFPQSFLEWKTACLTATAIRWCLWPGINPCNHAQHP